MEGGTRRRRHPAARGVGRDGHSAISQATIAGGR